MQRVIYLIIILLFCISSFAQTESLVKMSHASANFGFIPEMGEFTRKITMKSNTADTIRIGKISTYCDCVIAKFDNNTLLPGDSIILEIKLIPQKLAGKIYKVTHIYEESGARLAKVTVKAAIYKNCNNFEDIFVEPAVLNFSQFGDKGIEKAEFYINNVTDETIPLELIFSNDEYFELSFPVYVEANKKAKGTVKLTNKGKSSEFGESFTFKYINTKSQEFLFSVSVKRKVFTAKTDGN